MVAARSRKRSGSGKERKGTEEDEQERGITLEEKKKTRKKDERDEREGDAEFRFPPAVVPVRSTEEGVNAPRGGMDDTAGEGLMEPGRSERERGEMV